MAQRIIPLHRAEDSRPHRSAAKAQPSRTPPRQTASRKSTTDAMSPAATTEIVASSAPLPLKLAVTIAEAAQLLSISRSHLYPLVMRGSIPSFHIGHSHLIRVSALEEWIRQLEELAA